MSSDLTSTLVSTAVKARSALNNQFEDEDPDVEQGVENPLPEGEDDGDGRKPLGMLKENTMMEIAAGGLALVSVSTAIASMAIFSGPFVNGAGILACLIGPYSYWQQRNITDVKALKETHEALVKEVNHLETENERLKGLVVELGTSIENLEDVEDTFDHIKEMNIESIDEFREQVEESRQILAMMRKNLKASAIQNVITVVLNSDVDNNFTFDKDEVESLIHNLKSINGLEMNEEKFRKIITENDGSVRAVVAILNDIVNGDKNNGDGIFRVSGKSE